MEKKDEILLFNQMLTELRLKRKLTEWAFRNAKKLTERQVNAMLDEKGRIERGIEAINKRLEELER